MQVRPLSPALRKKAEEELKETSSKVSSSLKIIREWMKQQPHLHTVKPTDQWLIAFLRGNKYDIEKCKAKIEMYYTLKGTTPEFFGNRDPFEEKNQELLKLGVFLPLKNCNHDDSPRPCLTRPGPYSSNTQYSFADLVKVSLMIVEILLLEDDNFTVAGEEAIADLDGLGLRLLWQWTPAFAKKMITCSEKALSVRMKSVHIIYPPFGLGGAIAIFKMFAGAKIKERIYVHSKDTLFEQIDKSILPEEYGGTDGTVQELIDHWKAKVESYRDWFMDESASADESKRPVNNKKSGLADQWLIAFLRGCKYDIEKCKGKIEMYYTLKGTTPEFYGNRDPFDEKNQELLKLGVFLPLRKCNREDSPRPCLSRAGPYSRNSEHSLADFIKVSLMIVEILLLEDDNFTIAGEEVIADFDGLGLRLIWQWTPALAKKMTTCSEKALSARLKSLHIINPPFGVGGAIAIFKMFLGAKIKERIFAHSKDTLFEQMDKSILPEEYGGTDGTVQELIDHWKAKVESYRDWFMDESAYADESKRPVNNKNTGLFGWF